MMLNRLIKDASKNSAKRAKGFNWENPDLFSDKDLEYILNLKIEDHFAKHLNKDEVIFLELGAFLTDSANYLTEIGDYLVGEGIVSKPGDLSLYMPFVLSDLSDIKKNFKKLNLEQEVWHQNIAQSQGNSSGESYISDEVVYDFGDGWRVVYVPAAGEIKEYPGIHGSSYDRIIEGNKNGLCLGSSSASYQDNSNGKIYSVRTPDNNPAVTIRLLRESIEEAKGKNNLPPDAEGAKHALEWFKATDIDYRNSYDVNKFPPLNKEDALERFLSNRIASYKDGWVVSWYRKGIPEIDNLVEKDISEKRIELLSSGLNRKYKELLEPVFEHYALKYISLFEEEINNPDLREDGDKESSIINLEYRLFEPTNNSLKIYRKNPIFQKAVNKFTLNNIFMAKSLGVLDVEEYKNPDVSEAIFEKLKNIAIRFPPSFFLDIYDRNKEVGQFGLSIEKETELLSLAINNLLKDHKFYGYNTLKEINDAIFKYNLNKERKIFIDLAAEIIERGNYRPPIIKRVMEEYPFTHDEKLRIIIDSAYIFEEKYKVTGDISLISNIVKLLSIIPESADKFPENNRKFISKIILKELKKSFFDNSEVDLIFLYEKFLSLLDREEVMDIFLTYPEAEKSWADFYIGMKGIPSSGGLLTGDIYGFRSSHIVPDLLNEEGPVRNTEVPVGQDIEMIHNPEDGWDYDVEMLDMPEVPRGTDYRYASMVSKLIKLADALDSESCIEAADLVDNLIYKMQKTLRDSF